MALVSLAAEGKKIRGQRRRWRQEKKEGVAPGFPRGSEYLTCIPMTGHSVGSFVSGYFFPSIPFT